ncbi:cytochrome b2, mitochondrial precursor [Gorgonomyces haynaldii]|nr:cytochrome b2, mitochondrial precursor [Gorgonomyces haynaldii]
MISFEEVKKHTAESDCWMVIHGQAYNLTTFLNDHPGGKRILLKNAGKDATAEFEKIHSKDILKHLSQDCLLGDVDPSSLPKVEGKQFTTAHLPPLSTMLNLDDFEKLAEKEMSKEAWAYYSSAGDDEITYKENHLAFRKYWLKPKVLVNVKHVDTSTTVLGTRTSVPFYVTATALGKLGHPEGEVVLTRACGTRNVIQMIPTLASCSLDELVAARTDSQTQWFQLYVNEDRELTRRLVERAKEKGCTALFVTVDAPQLGRREKDMRVKFVDDAPDVHHSDMNRNQGAGRAISSFIDSSLNWEDITWFKTITDLPIILKGVQSGEDAIHACLAGVSGIVVSNHGGRQLDTVFSAVDMLRLIVDELKQAGLENKLTILVDGGVRRGTDVYKCLALGAHAVGIGRPWLYAMSTYGQEGVERAMDLLKEELEMVMRLMGTPTIKDIRGDPHESSIGHQTKLNVSIFTILHTARDPIPSPSSRSVCQCLCATRE